MRKIRVGILSILSVLLLCAGRGDRSIASDTSDSLLVFEGIPWSGSLTDGEGDGAMIFTPSDSEAPFVSAEGKWKSDTFDGEVQFTMEDDSVLELKYKKGVAAGEAKRTYEDGSWMEYQYKNGYPSGRLITYASDGTVSGVDRFYENRRIGDWCRLSEEAEYEELLKCPEDYYDEPFYFQGQVTDILDSPGHRYLFIRNEKNQTVICKYRNIDTESDQALAEEVAVGDDLTAYGFFEKSEILSLDGKYDACSFTTFGDEKVNLSEFVLQKSVFYHPLLPVTVSNDSVYSTLPIFKLFYLEREGGEAFSYEILDSENAESYDYEIMLRYPYIFSGFMLKETAEVRQAAIDYEKNRAELLLQKKNGNQLYYAEIELSDEQTSPALGELISFEAKLKGCHKLERRVLNGDYDEVTYISIPALEIEEIS